ncbi:MAG: putative molybdenum carrier protein [Gordonia sp. (in: high G+C Gram-positive bacteria)]|uniref:putative molybdenum carrier protein n=1 Tax=Gordonia sp. (in: high G+C Gram-positive bacteria) TaxID=84139 RepID=UPI0039E64EF9
MSRIRIARIVSGGQTGADRAALDAAIDAGLPYGGWCPLGGWAEDYPVAPGVIADYPHLREAAERRPEVRTRLNVRDSHATLVVRTDTGSLSAGTDLTVQFAADLRRPVLVSRGDDPDEVVSWLDGLPAELTLNVAGPRESEAAGTYEACRTLLRDVLRTVPAVH